MRRQGSHGGFAGPASGRVLRAGMVLLAVAGLVTVLAGCSPVSRHRVLTFFFTGVPPLGGEPQTVPAPAPPQPAVAAQVHVGLPALREPEFWMHGPYASRNCDRCHTPTDPLRPSDMGFVTSGKACAGCHTAFFARLKAEPNRWVHGPVANGECVACHHPHRSPNRFMLRVEPARLCDGCHGVQTAESNPAHGEAEGACLTCHDPHGGTTRALLVREPGD